jgi:hypothetical protein
LISKANQKIFHHEVIVIKGGVIDINIGFRTAKEGHEVGVEKANHQMLLYLLLSLAVM